MRVLVPVLGCILIAAKATLACSVVEVVETVPSSPNVRLTVVKDGTPREDATLVVRLQVNAQVVGSALKTDRRGNAELRNLVPGTYCVTAAADPKLGAVLCLMVSKGNVRKRSEFTLKLAPLPPSPPTLAEQLAEAAKSPPEARARAFEGIVTDVMGASISHAEIVVYALRSGKEPNLIKLEADEAGRFNVQLGPGNFAAAFRSPGFRTRFVGFTIGPNESQELAPIVLQVGSCT
jgi:hypothetical protein